MTKTAAAAAAAVTAPAAVVVSSSSSDPPGTTMTETANSNDKDTAATAGIDKNKSHHYHHRRPAHDSNQQNNDSLAPLAVRSPSQRRRWAFGFDTSGWKEYHHHVVTTNTPPPPAAVGNDAGSSSPGQRQQLQQLYMEFIRMCALRNIQPVMIGSSTEQITSSFITKRKRKRNQKQQQQQQQHDPRSDVSIRTMTQDQIHTWFHQLRQHPPQNATSVDGMPNLARLLFGEIMIVPVQQYTQHHEPAKTVGHVDRDTVDRVVLDNKMSHQQHSIARQAIIAKKSNHANGEPQQKQQLVLNKEYDRNVMDVVMDDQDTETQWPGALYNNNNNNRNSTGSTCRRTLPQIEELPSEATTTKTKLTTTMMTAASSWNVLARLVHAMVSADRQTKEKNKLSSEQQESTSSPPPTSSPPLDVVLVTTDAVFLAEDVSVSAHRAAFQRWIEGSVKPYFDSSHVRSIQIVVLRALISVDLNPSLTLRLNAEERNNDNNTNNSIAMIPTTATPSTPHVSKTPDTHPQLLKNPPNHSDPNPTPATTMNACWQALQMQLLDSTAAAATLFRYGGGLTLQISLVSMDGTLTGMHQLARHLHRQSIQDDDALSGSRCGCSGRGRCTMTTTRGCCVGITKRPSTSYLNVTSTGQGTTTSTSAGATPSFLAATPSWYHRSNHIQFEMPKLSDGTQCTVSLEIRHHLVPTESQSLPPTGPTASWQVQQCVPLASVNVGLMCGMPMTVQAAISSTSTTTDSTTQEATVEWQHMHLVVRTLLRWLNDRDMALLLRCDYITSSFAAASLHQNDDPHQQDELGRHCSFCSCTSCINPGNQQWYLLMAQSRSSSSSSLSHLHNPVRGLLVRYANAHQLLWTVGDGDDDAADATIARALAAEDDHTDDVMTTRMMRETTLEYMDHALSSLLCEPMNPFVLDDATVRWKSMYNNAMMKADSDSEAQDLHPAPAFSIHSSTTNVPLFNEWRVQDQGDDHDDDPNHDDQMHQKHVTCADENSNDVTIDDDAIWWNDLAGVGLRGRCDFTHQEQHERNARNIDDYDELTVNVVQNKEGFHNGCLTMDLPFDYD